MKTICPHCNQEYNVPDEYSGTFLQCSVCEKEFFCKAQIIPSYDTDSETSGWAIGGYISFLTAFFIGLSGILSPLTLFCGIMAKKSGDKTNGWICIIAGGITSFMIAATVMGAELKVINFIKSIPNLILTLAKGTGHVILFVFMLLCFAAVVVFSCFILFKLVKTLRCFINMKKVGIYLNLLSSVIAVIILICDLSTTDFWDFVPLFPWQSRLLVIYVLGMGCCNAWKLSKMLKGIDTSFEKIHNFNLNAYGALWAVGIAFLIAQGIFPLIDKVNMWFGIPILLALVPVPFAIFCLFLDRELGFKKQWKSLAKADNEE